MLEDKTNITDYLQSYHNGDIKKGLGIGIPEIDDYALFKKGDFNIINGLDNVGKTSLLLWWFLCLSTKHNLKWCIYSGENKAGQLMRQLIQFYTGTRLSDMTLAEVFRYEIEISNWFTFVDNTNFYKSKDLFKLFREGDYNGVLIDPFTGLDRPFTHEGNYDFLNESRQFCNSSGIALYVNTHVVSAAARKIYPEGHEYASYNYPVSKSDSEGGQPFGNRCDNFYTFHRLLGHPTMKYTTMWFTRKVKDTETGMEVNGNESPVLIEFNNGLGFTINGKNPLTNTVKNDLDLGELDVNEDFDNEIPAPF